jgi:aspartate-semialdehyde dehydrogenase
MSEQMRVGFPGYRGMVGNALMESMKVEGDFNNGLEPVFLSTSGSQIGQEVQVIEGQTHVVGDAEDLATLSNLDAIVTCQGSDYTSKVHGDLRRGGWNGYWIDAASYLRDSENATLVLDPVNRLQIESDIDRGVKDFPGVNCSTAMLALGAAGLFKAGLVESINLVTEQAISGAGARKLTRALNQIASVHIEIGEFLKRDAEPLEIAAVALKHLRTPQFTADEKLGQAILANMQPWIGEDDGTGHTSEERKAFKEINKLFEPEEPIPIDCTCTRIDTLRSHAIIPTITLKQDVPLDEIEDMMASAHPWIKLVPNTAEASLGDLTPVDVSETLDIAVGRLRKATRNPRELQAVIVGDQLLWGAAEPLRRTLGIVMECLL